MHLLVPIAYLLLCTQNLYAASNWQWTVPLRHLRDSGAKKIAVIATGEPIAVARQAHAEFVAAVLHESVGLTLLSAEDLDLVASVDDATIVARALAVNVERVVVLRAISQAHSTQVLSVSYSAKGILAAAEFVDLHAASLSARGEDRSTSPRVQVRSAFPSAASQLKTSASPFAVLHAPSARMTSVQDPQSLLRIDDRSSSPIRFLGLSIPTTPVAQVGRYGFELLGSSIFEELGQSELAAQYQQRDAVRTAMLVGGVGIGVGASACSLAAFVVAGSQPSAQQAWYIAGATSALAGGVIGLGLSAAGLLSDPNPVGLPYLRELADQHNLGQFDAYMGDE